MFSHMESKKHIVFFVEGLKSNGRGYYLARVLRTQEGVDSAFFDPVKSILSVTYFSDMITLDYMGELAYFSECNLISDQEFVDEQISLLLKKRRLTKWAQGGGFFLILSLVYLGLGYIIDSKNDFLDYLPFLLALAFLMVIFLLNVRVKRLARKR